MFFRLPKDLKVVIFDLDETLHKRDKYTLDLHILDILQYFYESGVILCLASMNMLGGIYLYNYDVIHMFKHICQRDEDNLNSYSKNKKDMLRYILKKTNCTGSSVLFFDDNISNFATAKKLGIRSICVNEHNLLTWRDVKCGLDLFDHRKRRYSYQGFYC